MSHGKLSERTHRVGEGPRSGRCGRTLRGRRAHHNRCDIHVRVHAMARKAHRQEAIHSTFGKRFSSGLPHDLGQRPCAHQRRPCISTGNAIRRGELRSGLLRVRGGLEPFRRKDHVHACSGTSTPQVLVRQRDLRAPPVRLCS